MIVLGIIPARGGSKVVPYKNIKQLNGKPLLSYTIEAALSVKLLSRVVVSTDDQRIADVAKQYGASVIMRPKELAVDESRTEDALLHVLDHLVEKEDFVPDIVLTLEPTSPLRKSESIDACIKVFENKDIDSVISVVETKACYGNIKDYKFNFLFPNQPRRRQDRDPLYQETGVVYGTRTEILRHKKSVTGDNIYPLVISPKEAIDINTEFDFKLAEYFMESGHGL